MSAQVAKIRSTWNVPAACWIVDLMDANGAPILTGIALVTGSDLLEQFAYLGIGGQIIAQTDHDTDAVPTFANLGSAGHMYFLTP